MSIWNTRLFLAGIALLGVSCYWHFAIGNGPTATDEKEGARNLLTEASLADLQESARLLQLVHERGYDRGKDLLAEFDRYRKPVM